MQASTWNAAVASRRRRRRRPRRHRQLPDDRQPRPVGPDNDGIGNACDSDLDGDGVSNGTDNCSTTPNADQRDADGDSIGDECDPFPGSTAGCKVTGGGQLVASNGDPATFSGNAQAKSATDVKGELRYQDHGPASGLTMKSTTVTSTIAPANQATVRGEGKMVAYLDLRIDYVDNGGPGRNDSFRIRLSNGYDSGVRRSPAATSRSTRADRLRLRRAPGDARARSRRDSQASRLCPPGRTGSCRAHVPYGNRKGEPRASAWLGSLRIRTRRPPWG